MKLLVDDMKCKKQECKQKLEPKVVVEGDEKSGPNEKRDHWRKPHTHRTRGECKILAVNARYDFADVVF
jgi:hypothetical protein